MSELFDAVWYISAPTFTVAGTDDTSGPVSCPDVAYSGTDGTGKTETGTCTDGAGLSTNGVNAITIKIDRVKPVTTITAVNDNGAGLGSPTVFPIAEFSFTSSDAANFLFSVVDDTSGHANSECRVDPDTETDLPPYADCDFNTAHQLLDLPDGERVFDVRAIDAAGNPGT